MQKFIIDNEYVNEEDFYAQLEEAIDNACENYLFDQTLDDYNDTIEILGCSYCVSEVLYKTDPTAYRCARCDYAGSLLEDAKYNLDRGETVEYDDKTFEIEEIDEEDEEDAE